jgi:hypothetical protein
MGNPIFNILGALACKRTLNTVVLFHSLQLQDSFLGFSLALQTTRSARHTDANPKFYYPQGPNYFPQPQVDVLFFCGRICVKNKTGM